MTADPATILELRSQKKRQRVVAGELNLSRARVGNLERVMRRSKPGWLSWVSAGKLRYKHLEAVLCLPEDKAEDLLRRTMAGGWSAQRLRDEVNIARGKRRPDDPHPNADVAHLENQLTEMLATPVSINTSERGGELVIRFTDNEVLEGLLERLGYRFEY